MGKTCLDCGKSLTGHGKPGRCKSCAAKHRYIQKYGSPPKILIANCDGCSKEFVDYESNRKNSKHGFHFCSYKCRATWTGRHNSISRGGDGVKRSKSETDKIYYRKTSEECRRKVIARYWRKRDEILLKLKMKSWGLKKELVDAYGGKYKCCGETHLEFLTIDHIKGDGHSHRKQVGKGRNVYKDLKKRGYPKGDYQILCFNCNTALGFYGYCPHRPHIKRKMNKVAKNPGRPRTVV